MRDSQHSNQEKRIEWTPARGLCSAVAWGSVWTIILMIATGALAWFFPPVVQAALLRAFLAFLICWILFEVVQRSAGMAGWPCTVLAIALTACVILSHHGVWAVHGAWTTEQGFVIGWVWLEPATLLWLNATAAVGIGACTLIRHDGGGDLRTLVGIFSRRIGM